MYGGENEADGTTDKKKVLILGSGPIRIGQGIEFDFCSVHCTWAFEKEGYETIIINNNPETVSTDFDIADKLYFEPLTPEDVENVVDIEKPDGAVVQFGGQTAIKLTEALIKMGVKILGTSAANVDAAEDRELLMKSWNSVIFLDQRDIQYILQKRLSGRLMNWDIRCWYVLPMSLADRECRLLSMMRCGTVYRYY